MPLGALSVRLLEPFRTGIGKHKSIRAKAPLALLDNMIGLPRANFRVSTDLNATARLQGFL
jgi:hypothetical protein